MSEIIYPRIEMVNKNNVPMGTSATYDRIHHKNNPLFHRAVNGYVVDGEGNVYLQRRSDNVNWGGTFCPTFSGHVDAGESPLMAIIREAREEGNVELVESDLGDEVVIYEDNLRFLKQTSVYEKEFTHTYFIRRSDLQLQNTEEVEEFVDFTLKDFRELIEGNRDELFPYSDDYFINLWMAIAYRWNVGDDVLRKDID